MTSKPSLRTLANSFHATPVYMAERDAAGLSETFQEMRTANSTTLAETTGLFLAEVAAGYFSGRSVEAERKPFVYHDGLAIIPVHGVLLNRFSWASSWATGYSFIRAQMQAADADSDVKTIVFDVNSGGGLITGLPELAAEIKALETKTLAIVDAVAFSAAYWIASSTDRIVLTPSGMAGSIGAVIVHISYEKMLADAGIKVTLLAGGPHKADGNMYEDLSESVAADLTKRTEDARELFARTVAENRGIDFDAVMATEARIYTAQEALSLGLIDAIASPMEAISAALLNSDDDEEQEIEMKTETTETAPSAADTQKLIAEATAAAVSAERERVKGIMGCEEAKDRSALANHLAAATSVSVEEAKGILAAAAKDVPATTGATSALETAMTATGGGTGLKEEGTKAPADADAPMTAESMLGSYAKASGHKLTIVKS